MIASSPKERSSDGFPQSTLLAVTPQPGVAPFQSPSSIELAALLAERLGTEFAVVASAAANRRSTIWFY